MTSRTGSDSAAQQNHFLHCIWFCCTAGSSEHVFSCQSLSRSTTVSGTMNPRIVAISGPLRGSEFFIDEDDLYIGRGARSHIRLEDSLVSLKHCSLYWLGDRCMLQDRLSANGTFVNEFFFRAKLVVHGDHIRVGRSVFVYLLEDEVDEALLAWCRP